MSLIRTSARPAFIPALGIGVEHQPGYINRRSRLNAHDLVEMNLVVSGRGTYLLDDRRFAVGPGSLCIVHFGQAHCLLTEDTGLDLYNLYLDPRRMALPPLDGRLAEALPRILPLHPGLAHRANRCVHMVLRDAATALARVRELESELHTRAPGWQQAATLLAQLFLVQCARQACAGPVAEAPERAVPLPARVAEVCAAIEASLSARLSLSDLAEVAGISPVQLSRVFRSHTGMPVMRYVRQRRLEQALGLLAATERGVAEIAAECGFADLSNFHHAFSRAVGTSPAAYRRKLATSPSRR